MERPTLIIDSAFHRVKLKILDIAWYHGQASEPLKVFGAELTCKSLKIKYLG